MTFGLCNAGQTFQRFIHEVIRGLDFCFPYIDDILIASENEELHIEHLNQVFQRLEEYGVVINIDKCVLGQSAVNFLGHRVDENGIKPLPEKVSAILNFPTPKTVKEIRRFVAMLNFYRRFIPNAATTQIPLLAYQNGNKKNDNTPITWTPEALDAFEKCKTDLSKVAILAHPSDKFPICVMVDASDVAIGGVLQQKSPEGWQPLSFFSRKLTTTQKKYSTYDRELLAIYTVVKYYRHMLEGRKFIIFTDHKPLTYAFQQNLEKASPRQYRQLDFLSQFSTDIRHIKGIDNLVADTLSRIETISGASNLDYKQFAEDQVNDSELKQFLSKPESTSLILKTIEINTEFPPLYCDTSTKNVRPFVPKNQRKNVFHAFHDLAHNGFIPTYEAIRKRFVWPKMGKDIKVLIQTCITCQRAKVSRHTRSEVSSYPIPKDRFCHINIDLVGPLPSYKGFTYLLTCIDRFTRWTEAIPMENCKAITVAEAFYKGWIARFGVPLKISTDQGRQFESQLFKELGLILGAQRIRTSPYHPSANGMIERWHRCLKTALMCHSCSNWYDSLPTVLLGLRASFIESIKCSPSELDYGTTLRLPGDFFLETSDSLPSNEFV